VFTTRLLLTSRELIQLNSANIKRGSEAYAFLPSISLALQLDHPIGVLVTVGVEPSVVWRITPLWSVKDSR
jgi:hypothetical protein